MRKKKKIIGKKIKHKKTLLLGYLFAIFLEMRSFTRKATGKKWKKKRRKILGNWEKSDRIEVNFSHDQKRDEKTKNEGKKKRIKRIENWLDGNLTGDNNDDDLELCSLKLHIAFWRSERKKRQRKRRRKIVALWVNALVCGFSQHTPFVSRNWITTTLVDIFAMFQRMHAIQVDLILVVFIHFVHNFDRHKPVVQTIRIWLWLCRRFLSNACRRRKSKCTWMRASSNNNNSDDDGKRAKRRKQQNQRTDLPTGFIFQKSLE